MPHRHLATFIFAVLAAFAFIACSDQSPVGPRAIPAGGVQDVTPLVQSVAGTYVLSVEATIEGLVLTPEVREEASGLPAQSGLIRLQQCSLQGAPAPSSTCDTGSGHWVPAFTTLRLTPADEGSISVLFGFAPSGTTIGFRFLYNGQGGNIESGASNLVDHTF
jgi:hypothetical protein